MVNSNYHFKTKLVLISLIILLSCSGVFFVGTKVFAFQETNVDSPINVTYTVATLETGEDFNSAITTGGDTVNLKQIVFDFYDADGGYLIDTTNFQHTEGGAQSLSASTLSAGSSVDVVDDNNWPNWVGYEPIKVDAGEAGSIKAYFYEYSGDTYIYVLSNYAVTLNLNSDEMFSDFSSLQTIIFNNCLLQNGTTSNDDMFNGCVNLTTFGNFPQFETFGARMFSECDNLSSVEMTKVTSIGTACFSNSGITTINAPLLQTIGDFAFYDCSYLQTFAVPKSVTTIGDSAFESSNLTTITMGSSSSNSQLQSMGDSCFKNCANLTTLDLTYCPSLTTLSANLCYNCPNLVTFAAPNVTSIGSNVLTNCTNIKYITVPFVGSGENMNASAYFGYLFGKTNNIGISTVYTQLTEIRITGNSSYTTLNMFAFNGDSSLTIDFTNIRVVLGQYINKIGYYAFADTNIKSTNLSIGTAPLEVIDDCAFRDCQQLTSFTVPSSVTTIGQLAFSGSKISNIMLYPNISSLGTSCFKDCTSLTTFSLLYVSQVTTVPESICEGCTALTSVTFNSNTTSIGAKAFYNVGSSLKSITIPTKTTTIGDNAFYGCSGLTSLTIPSSVTTIGQSTFENCTALTSVNMQTSTNRGVAVIGSSAFKSCSGLTSVTVPTTLTSIGAGAFQGCSGLTSITLPFTGSGTTSNVKFSHIFNDSVPTSLKTVVITGSTGHATLYSNSFPSGVTTSIQTLTIGKNFVLTNATPSSAITTIQSSALSGLQSTLTSLTIPFPEFSGSNILAKIFGLSANSSLGSTLKRVYLTGKSSATTLPTDTFTSCANLTDIGVAYNINMPTGKSNTFYGCSSLQNLTLNYNDGGNEIYRLFNASSFDTSNIPTNMKFILTGSVSEDAFRSTRSDIIIELADNGVTNRTIGSNAFYKYFPENKTTFVIPEGFTSIGFEAFDTYSDGTFTNITFPTSLTSIGNQAFYGQESLTSITIPDSVTRIGEQAFWGCFNVTVLTIGTGVTSIGISAFFNLKSCQTVYYNAKYIESFEIGHNNWTGIHSVFAGIGYSTTNGTTFYIGSSVTRIPTNFLNNSLCNDQRPMKVYEVKYVGSNRPVIGTNAFAGPGIRTVQS